MAVTKKEMIKKIADDMDSTQTSVKKMFDAFFEVLQEILMEENRFTEYGFGTFYTEEQEERPGFNPSTQKKMIIPKRVKIHFKPSDVLKDAVNEE